MSADKENTEQINNLIAQSLRAIARPKLRVMTLNVDFRRIFKTQILRSCG